MKTVKNRVAAEREAKVFKETQDKFAEEHASTETITERELRRKAEVASKAKEPWEMSNAEWKQEHAFEDINPYDHKYNVEKAIAEGKITSHPDYPELGKVAQEVKESWKMTKESFTSARREDLDKQRRYLEKVIPENMARKRSFDKREPEPIPYAVRARIEKEVKEFEYRVEEAEILHERLVRNAKAEGKTIPDEVLEDYPELGKVEESNSPEPKAYSGDYIKFQTKGGAERYGEVSSIQDSIVYVIPDGGKNPILADKVISIEKAGKRRERIEFEKVLSFEDWKGNQPAGDRNEWIRIRLSVKGISTKPTSIRGKIRYQDAARKAAEEFDRNLEKKYHFYLGKEKGK